MHKFTVSYGYKYSTMEKSKQRLYMRVAEVAISLHYKPQKVNLIPLYILCHYNYSFLKQMQAYQEIRVPSLGIFFPN